MNNEPTDLVRALTAISRSQRRWLDDLGVVCAGDPQFLDAFRRWREWLTLLKLQIIRAEGRLLHYLLVPEDLRPRREFRGTITKQRDYYRHWDAIIPPYLQALHIDTSYLRMSEVRDCDAEVTTALMTTDLVALASIADTTQQALASSQLEAHTPWLEDLAFYHVLAPWKVQGLRPLGDVLRWLDSFLAEMDEL